MMLYPPVAELADKVGSRYQLVNLVARRARTISSESEEKQIQSFKNRLEKSRINVTIRREMGRDIDGACGQLRRSFMK